MTENFYMTEKFNADHTNFGGLIYQSDFNTEYCNGNIASRITSDWRFDKKCKTNAEYRNKNIKDE